MKRAAAIVVAACVSLIAYAVYELRVFWRAVQPR